MLQELFIFDNSYSLLDYWHVLLEDTSNVE